MPGIDQDKDTTLSELADATRRLDVLTNHNGRQDEMIAAIIKDAVAIDQRVRALEAAQIDRKVTEAREDERDKALYSRLEKIENAGSRVVWAIATGLVGAIVLWIINGGLKLP